MAATASPAAPTRTTAGVAPLRAGQGISFSFAEWNRSSRRLPDRAFHLERVRYERTGGLHQASGVAQRFPVRLLP